MTRTKTALETTADLAAKYAAHTLRQMLYVAASDDNIDAAVEAIGQHATALMKLTIEREHVVMRQRASGGTRYTEREVEMFARGLHCQDYFRGNSKRVWAELSIDERNDVLRIARRALGPRADAPGEPRK